MAEQAQTVQQPLRVPLVAPPGNRDSSQAKDAKMVNCYAERTEREGEFQIYKRPGLLAEATLSSTGAGRGVFSWKGSIYAIWGTDLEKDGTSVGTVDGTGGVYRFEVNNQTAPAKLQLSNGVKAYNYDATNGLVEITDGDFVKPHVKGWAYLDGTTYYMTADGAIRGSGIGDTVNWDALNKIIAQIEPDDAVFLAKQLVYVVALKEWTTELFYDAANPTGSPLAPVQGAKLNFGCLTAESVQDVDGVLVWVASSRHTSPQIMAMEGAKASLISTRAIDRLLEQSDFSAVYSWQFKQRGHSFYGLTLADRNVTMVYDLTEKLWSFWTDSSSNYFPIVSATGSRTYGSLFQHATNGKLYQVNDDYTSDDGSAILVDLYTPNFDGGTKRIKQLGSMEFVGDQTEDSALLVRVSDDDYQSWSNFREVDMRLLRPKLPNCGSFYRRAWHIRHRANTRLRLQAIELQLDLGVL